MEVILYVIFAFLIYIYLTYSLLKSDFNCYVLGLVSFPVKVLYSLLMLYAVVFFWDYGDLTTYYDFAVSLANGKESFLDHLWGSYLVAVFHTFFIYVFGESLIGLFLIAVLTSYIYMLLLYRSFTNLTGIKSSLLFAFLIFTPGIGVQASFIGKEFYILPLLGIFFWLFSRSTMNLWVLTLVILIISLMRPYQGAILLLSMIVAYIFTVNMRKLVFMSFLSIPSLGAYIYITDGSILNQVRDIYELGLSGYMLNSYGLGNTGLKSFPFPLSIFQVFRPFFFEAHNFFAVLKSIENLFFVFAFLYVFWNSRNIFGLIARTQSVQLKRFLILVITYISVNIFLFSFSQNIGDLSRRQVYFIPELLVLATFTFYLRRNSFENSSRI